MTKKNLYEVLFASGSTETVAASSICKAAEVFAYGCDDENGEVEVIKLLEKDIYVGT